ncbi:MAG: hypothetical protein AVDCRST_MAG05-4832 [uncultured Rubrobacteraceae bacterium]|uniref:Lipoprotein n=1 Tax=uncultured Rubrobacteraceae bacterium TaxID=349277 RepID=A0A6J4TYA0_9ACTN|nr:MAG: hypothetical protein AVDCRST_MAG05-4832 [uncultured Rubrobacteraceae bacterium]
MKRRVSLAALLLVWSLIAGCTAGSQAGCALAVRGPGPTMGAPGEAFRVHEEGFTTGCDDTGQPGRPPPQQNIRIEFRQEERTWNLATADATRGGVLDAELEVPDDAQTGRATLIIRTEDGVPVEGPFRVLDDGSKVDQGLEADPAER